MASVNENQYLIGIDIGGTFTDVVILNDKGGLWFDKAHSTISPDEGVMQGLKNCTLRAGQDLRQILNQTQRFSHGTTIGTNTLIQRKGVEVGLITTRGLEDITLIMRGAMGRTLGLPREQALDFIFAERAAPLVPKRHIIGITERIDANGNLVVPLRKEEVRQGIRRLLEEGIRNIAVVFLWALRNPAHEQSVREIAREIDSGANITLSSDVSPLLGEYERAMTTVANSYIRPLVTHYAERLESDLRQNGLKGRLLLMKSSGGKTVPDMLFKDAVGVLNSGPVGGLVASKYLGELMGYSNIVSTDVGGTSFDVGIIHQGKYEEDNLPVVSHGICIQYPSVKVKSIGAGGGSIAWTDGMRLMVGPMSSGSNPGPVCYAQGGADPTLTDAMVVLGYINPETFFSGRKKLNKQLAEKAIADRIAIPLGLNMIEASMGIYEITTAKMADLVRQETIESGYDPRQLIMFAYGGAGPAHAAFYAKRAGINEVVIPYTASVFSALGIALADIKFTYAKFCELVLDDEKLLETYNSTFNELEIMAFKEMASVGAQPEEVLLIYKLDMRYMGQMKELTIIAPLSRVTTDDVNELRLCFERNYEEKYGTGTTWEKGRVEIENFRLEAVWLSHKPSIPTYEQEAEDPSSANIAFREVHFRETGFIKIPVFQRNLLKHGNRIGGPSLVDADDHVIVIPPGFDALADQYKNIILKARG